MSVARASVSITAGQTDTVYVGTPTTVGAVVISNESPYALMVSAGSGSQWIMAQTVDLLPCNNSAFSGNITITASNYLSNSADAPSFLIYLTAYTPGEAIPGTFPAPLVRLTTGTAVTTNNPATTIEQDLLTPFVLSGLSPSKDLTVPNQLDVTAGVALCRQSDSSLLRQALVASTFFTSVHSTTYYLDLNPDGSWSWGTSHSTQSNYLTIAQVTTDASGNISVVTPVAPSSTTLLSGFGGTVNAPTNFSIPAYLYFTNAGFPTGLGEMTFDGANLYLYATKTGASTAIFMNTYVGGSLTFLFAVGNPGLQPVTSWIDTAGVLHATAPVTLAAGNQESGPCGRIFTAAGANEGDGYFVNFKAHMTNVPSSITLTVSTSSNVKAGTPTATVISKDGFLFFVEANGVGVTSWQGTYTTVGN